ncbi:hypothetical protein GLOTRDRAFT_138895 [Gloeophyllum trabeum ATCC 11539]|uniref:Uncharacterized protein n=1 Tax=Gloeophyllum trabeum (strain ATCC 11539 / FP-39264 / Madison 617) TaxID=670483 RepID=S7Q782_GLOTA|nr:uncharacterized protein GLOTRDRAFT_138895 [Gloeophyllum trabeum ATCC 11539]EPQ55303.1 hypothetical protein GLOTRDRAFT_138895 [Gloeophyllum trabeum ATCC 11539]
MSHTHTYRYRRADLRIDLALAGFGADVDAYTRRALRWHDKTTAHARRPEYVQERVQHTGPRQELVPGLYVAAYAPSSETAEGGEGGDAKHTYTHVITVTPAPAPPSAEGERAFTSFTSLCGTRHLVLHLPAPPSRAPLDRADTPNAGDDTDTDTDANKNNSRNTHTSPPKLTQPHLRAALDFLSLALPYLPPHLSPSSSHALKSPASDQDIEVLIRGPPQLALDCAVSYLSWASAKPAREVRACMREEGMGAWGGGVLDREEEGEGECGDGSA